jgi:2-oxoisovalerate dehydrogenase E2 component (dihydrolipoyl transacylase)
MIRSQNLDYTKITPTGKGGRILKEDVLKYQGKLDSNSFNSEELKKLPEAFSANTKKIEYSQKEEKINDKIEKLEKSNDIKKSTSASVSPTSFNDDKVIKISGFNKAMTKSMTIANTIPQFLFNDEYNVDKLIKLRDETNKMYSKEIKFSFIPFFVKAVSNALKEFPNLNSCINPQVGSDGFIYEYIIKAQHNISVAIDGPEGLIVPNIKDVGRKSIKDIQLDLINLRQKADNRTLTNDDLVGGSICVSSVGNIGGKIVSPIILPPQVCIIGITKIIDKLSLVNLENKDEKSNSLIGVFKENEKIGISSQKYVNFNISADHRIIDGAYVARFSERIRHYIENPIKILL